MVMLPLRVFVVCLAMFAGLFVATAHAQSAEFGNQPTEDSLDSLLGSVLYADSGVQTQTGELTVLKYVDNSKATVPVPVGNLQRVPHDKSRLVVRMMECRKDYQDKAGNDIAWLDIFMANVAGELAEDADPVFSGWVWRLYPSVSTLQHPQFDVRLAGCVAEEAAATE